MTRKHFGRLTFGIALASLVTVATAGGQTTKCRGYKALVTFGEACLWGCGGQIACNCVVGACADGTVVAN